MNIRRCIKKSITVQSSSSGSIVRCSMPLSSTVIFSHREREEEYCQEQSELVGARQFYSRAIARQCYKDKKVAAAAEASQHALRQFCHL